MMDREYTEHSEAFLNNSKLFEIDSKVQLIAHHDEASVLILQFSYFFEQLLLTFAFLLVYGMQETIAIVIVYHAQLMIKRDCSDVLVKLLGRCR